MNEAPRTASYLSIGFLPYALSLVSLPVFYVLLIHWMDQPFLAVIATAIGVAATFVVTRIAVSRGRLSITTVAVVLPLLTAAGCVLVQQMLMPYIQRQRAIDSLRSNGVKCQLSTPDQCGEWMRSKSGTMIPIWMMGIIGKDCLSGVRSIEGAIQSVQASYYRQLDASRLWNMELIQTMPGEHLTEEFVMWLNNCPSLERIQLDFQHFSDADGKALEKLHARIEQFIHLKNIERLEDFASLRGEKQLTVSGKSLSVAQARQFAQFADLKSLIIDTEDLDVDAIVCLEPLASRCTLNVNCHGDGSIPSKLAKVGWNRLVLEGLRPNLDDAVLDEILNDHAERPNPASSDLCIMNSQISFEDCSRLVALFQCSHFTITTPILRSTNFDQTSPVNPGAIDPYQPLTSDEIESLWTNPRLTEISEFDGNTWRQYQRPAENFR